MATQEITPEALIELMRGVSAQIPRYAQLTTAEKLALRKLSYTAPAFVAGSADLLGASENVQTLLGRPLADVRKDIDEEARWRTAEREVRGLLDGIVAANLLRRHRLALTAHQTYQIGRQLARSKDTADKVLPHVKGLQQLLARRAGRKPAPAEPAVPTVKS